MTPARGMPVGRRGRGALVLVGTPIGNLGDLSPRAVEALAGADVIACEDTRHTGKLLALAGVAGPRLISVHGHNEAARTTEVVEMARSGKRVAVVSDAGMPGISDPGERLVAHAVATGVPVEVVPGPSAVVAALVVSGFPTERFCFEGFLPRKGPGRRERLAAVAREPRTVVAYEAPHRMEKTVDDLAGACGDDRRVVLARELTKLYEEVWRGTLGEARQWVRESTPRGEFVVVLEGAPAEEYGTTDVEEALSRLLAGGTSRKEAVAEVSAALGVPKRTVYDAALRLAGRGADGD